MVTRYYKVISPNKWRAEHRHISSITSVKLNSIIKVQDSKENISIFNQNLGLDNTIKCLGGYNLNLGIRVIIWPNEVIPINLPEYVNNC